MPTVAPSVIWAIDFGEGQPHFCAEGTWITAFLGVAASAVVYGVLRHMGLDRRN